MTQVRQSQFILRVSNHFVKFSRSKLKLSRTDGRIAYYYNNTFCRRRPYKYKTNFHFIICPREKYQRVNNVEYVPIFKRKDTCYDSIVYNVTIHLNLFDIFTEMFAIMLFYCSLEPKMSEYSSFMATHSCLLFIIDGILIDQFAVYFCIFAGYHYECNIIFKKTKTYVKE